MVVYVALASLLLGDIANRIGRVILQDLVSYLGRIYAYGDPATTPPITVLIDEFGDVAFPLFTNALNKGGGANARFILAQQSLADAEAAMGPAQARRVLDNLNTKIWCRLADDRTAAEATEGLGLCTVRLPDDGVGLSYGGVGGLSGNAQRRLAAREVPLVRPAWLTALPRGEALVRMKGEVWKLRVPLLTPVPPETLETLGLTALWTALDPATVDQRKPLHDEGGEDSECIAAHVGIDEGREKDDEATVEKATPRMRKILAGRRMAWTHTRWPPAYATRRLVGTRRSRMAAHMEPLSRSGPGTSGEWRMPAISEQHPGAGARLGACLSPPPAACQSAEAVLARPSFLGLGAGTATEP